MGNAVNLKKVFFQKGSNLEGIGDYAFFYTSLKKLIFKKGSRIEVIGNYAFAECEELKKVILPPSVTKIGVAAFWNSDLEKVIFKKGSNLKTIYEYAFRYNWNLRTINIPPGVDIKSEAFDGTGCSEDIFTPGATIVDCIVETKGLRGN